MDKRQLSSKSDTRQRLNEKKKFNMEWGFFFPVMLGISEWISIMWGERSLEQNNTYAHRPVYMKYKICTHRH